MYHSEVLITFIPEILAENSAQSTTFFSAVTAFQNQQTQMNDTFNTGFSSHITPSSSLAAPNFSHHNTSEMNSFVFNAVSSAATYRYPQYLNQEFHKRAVGPISSHLQVTG